MSAAAHAAGKFVGLTSSNLLVSDLVVKSFQPLMTRRNVNALGSKHQMKSLTEEFSLGIKTVFYLEPIVAILWQINKFINLSQQYSSRM